MATLVDSIAIEKSEKHIRWPRAERTELFSDYRQLLKSGVSERAAAQQLKVPRSTLHAWRTCGKSLDVDPSVLSFFESTEGLAFLHRLTLAMQVVFIEAGACGIRLVSKVLELSGLDRFVAASFESQRRLNIEVQNKIIHFAEAEKARLAAAMPKKNITIAADETFRGGLTLVAIEPESNFILLEQASEKRDCKSWQTATEEAIKGLNCRIIQTTADLGKGLVSYVENVLGVNHSPDIFHVQQDLSRATSASISAKVRAAQRVHEQKNTEKIEVDNAARLYNETLETRGRGRPPAWTTASETAASAVKQAEVELHRIKEIQVDVRAAIKKLGEDYHFIDLATGCRQNSTLTISKLQSGIDKIRELSCGESLAKSSFALIDKAERVLPKMGETLDFVADYVKKRIEQLGLSASEERIFHSKLVPSYYLERIAGKRNKEDGKNLHKLSTEMRDPLFNDGGVFAGYDDKIQAWLKREAYNLARIFQRSSSCVEGRNGLLSFRNHGLRGISSRKRACLTAMHNFFVNRGKQGTAAERFFENKPKDLFQELLGNIEVPRSPRRYINKAI